MLDNLAIWLLTASFPSLRHRSFVPLVDWAGPLGLYLAHWAFRRFK